MSDVAFKVLIGNGYDDILFKTIMLKGEKGDQGEAGGALIDDTTTSTEKTWSSSKINSEISAKPSAFSQLNDVAITNISDGQMPVYDFTTGKWKNQNVDASTLKYNSVKTIKDELDAKASSLTDLDDVNITNPQNDQGMIYDSTTGKWKNGNPAVSGDLDDLDDVQIDLNTLADGQAVKWDAQNNKWVNGAVSTTSALVDLTDVALDSSIPDFSSLVYNATEGKWKNKQLTIVCTEAQYNTWKNASPSQLIPNTHYVITDAPNLNATASDIEYTSGVSVADELTSLASGQTPQAVTGISYNSTNINSGSFTCYKIGRLVMLDIAALQTKVAIGSNEEELLSGLPLPLVDTGRYSLFDGDGTSRARVKVTSDGKLRMWHNPSNYTVGTGFYGNVYYISAT